MSSDASFFGDGSQSIQTAIHKDSNLHRDCSLEQFYELPHSIEWLKSHSVIKKVALQFPDELLGDSVTIITSLQKALSDLTFFILADTSYGSCCVDTVAAQHYNADVLIHYGPSCLSPSRSIPVLWIFGQAPLDITECCDRVEKLVSGNTERSVVLMFDTQYDHIIDDLYPTLHRLNGHILRSHLRSCATTESQSDNDSENGSRIEVNGRSWQKVDSSHTHRDYDVLYIGAEGRTLTNLMMVMNNSHFYSYNPKTKSHRQETLQVNKSLMKRFYLVEKAKDANIIGIVVGTLAVSNYLAVHDRLRQLIKKAGKKSYSIVVGKLNTPKLANFMEVDIFVLVACSENSLVDSSEFYKPVITPYELELACNTDRQWTGDYVTDFRTLLPGGDNHQSIPDTIEYSTDVSLLSGGMRSIGINDNIPDSGKQLAVRENNTALATVSAKSAGEFLAGRSWGGLEVALGETPVEKARQGTSGIAMGYEKEPNT